MSATIFYKLSGSALRISNRNRVDTLSLFGLVVRAVVVVGDSDERKGTECIMAFKDSLVGPTLQVINRPRLDLGDGGYAPLMKQPLTCPETPDSRTCSKSK